MHGPLFDLTKRVTCRVGARVLGGVYEQANRALTKDLVTVV